MFLKSQVTLCSFCTQLKFFFTDILSFLVYYSYSVLKEKERDGYAPVNVQVIECGANDVFCLNGRCRQW